MGSKGEEVVNVAVANQLRAIREIQKSLDLFCNEMDKENEGKLKLKVIQVVIFEKGEE